LGEEMCGVLSTVEGPRPRGRPKRERSSERAVKHVNLTRRMLWIVVDGGNC